MKTDFTRLIAGKRRYGAVGEPYPSPDPGKFNIMAINGEPYYRFLGTGRKNEVKKVSTLVIK